MSAFHRVHCMPLMGTSLIAGYSCCNMIMLKNYRNKAAVSKIPTDQVHESQSKYVDGQYLVSASNTDHQVILLQKCQSTLILTSI